jgi:hypothetical protein
MDTVLAHSKHLYTPQGKLKVHNIKLLFTFLKTSIFYDTTCEFLCGRGLRTIKFSLK